MEVVTLEARIPSGHMWLAMTFTVRFRDDDDQTDPTPDPDFNDVGVGMSEELEEFLGECIGKIELDKKQFRIRFSDPRDFMRFKLLDLEPRPAGR
jgi:hypothetical protein